MGKKLYIVVFLCCLHSLTRVWAQNKFNIVERHEFKAMGLEVRDAIQAIDGFIYVVGKVSTANDGSQGVLLKMDVAGNVLDKLEYGGPFDDELNGIVQLLNDDLLLVGSTVIDHNEHKSAWLVKITTDGTVIKHPLPNNGNKEVSITHIAQNEHGVIMLAGTKTQDQKIKSCWVNTLPNSKTFPKEMAFNNLSSTYENITYLGSFYNGNFLICGNCVRKNGGQKTWCSIYSPTGEQTEKNGFVPSKNLESLVAGNMNLTNGNIALIGESTQINSYFDVQIVEVNEVLGAIQEEEDTFWGENASDLAKGVLPTLKKGVTLLAVWSNTVGGGRDRLVLLSAKDSILQEKATDIQLAKLILTFDNQYIGVGTITNRKETRLWWLVIHPNDEIKLEAGDKGQNLTPPISPNQAPGGVKSLPPPQSIVCHPATFQDNNDGILRPGEGGEILVDIENTSNQPFNSLYVQAEIIGSTVKGLMLEYNTRNIVVIPPHRKTTARFRIVANANLTAGTTEIRFTLKRKDSSTELCKTVGKVVSQLKIYGKIYPVGNIQRTNKEQEIFKLKYNTNQRTGNVSIKINPSLPLLGNSREVIDTTSQEDGDNYLYTITLKLPLNLGANKFVVKAFDSDQLIDTTVINIERTEVKPNLHFLGIGPVTSLNYNRKDVQDLEKVIQAQKGLGLYENIYVHTLTEKEETQKTRIENEFENLLNRNDASYPGKDRIQSEDVVIVFISSHGLVHTDTTFRIIPSDYNSRNSGTTSVNMNEMLLKYLLKIKSKVIVFIDACHSGGVKDLGLSGAINRLMAAKPGQFVLTSSGNAEYSYEHQAWENGAFTEILVEALNSTGKTVDTNGNGFISLEELSTYVKRKVPEIALKFEYIQNPQTPKQEIDIEPDLDIFMVKKN